jgi:transposase
MNEALKRLVWERAADTCEYCRLPQWLDLLPFQIDHVIAEKHHGATAPENLALSCLNERRLNWLKECRALATRFDKLALNYLATVKLAILQRYLRKLAPNDSSDRP